MNYCSGTCGRTFPIKFRILYIYQGSIWKQCKAACDMTEMTDGAFVESLKFMEEHNKHKEGISLLRGLSPC